jgi:hypothetical protein
MVETHLNDKKSLFFHKKFKFLLTLLLSKYLEKGATKSNPNEQQRHYQQLVVVMNMNHGKKNREKEERTS